MKRLALDEEDHISIIGIAVIVIITLFLAVMFVPVAVIVVGGL